MVNAGKIQSYKAICRQFKKFVKSNRDKSKLKGFIDDNNSVKSNAKEFAKLIKMIENRSLDNEIIKEDDLSKIIQLKILLKYQVKTEVMKKSLGIPDCHWSDL